MPIAKVEDSFGGILRPKAVCFDGFHRLDSISKEDCMISQAGRILAQVEDRIQSAENGCCRILSGDENQEKAPRCELMASCTTPLSGLARQKLLDRRAAKAHRRCAQAPSRALPHVARRSGCDHVSGDRFRMTVHPLRDCVIDRRNFRSKSRSGPARREGACRRRIWGTTRILNPPPRSSATPSLRSDNLAQARELTHSSVLA